MLCRYRPRWSIDLQFRPFFLSGVMAVVGKKNDFMSVEFHFHALINDFICDAQRSISFL